MAVAFDAVGPSAAGATVATNTALTFAHTITGASTVLLAGIAVDNGSDTGLSCTATYNSLPMTSLLVRHSGGAAAGFLQVFGIIAGAGASHNVVATVAGGTPANITGGSISFTGAGQTLGAAFGSPTAADSAGGTPTTATATTSGATTSGNIVAGFVINGAGITSATSPSTSRFINSATGTGAGRSCAGATSPSTGSTVTMAWTVSPDYFGEILVEVLAAPVGIPTGLASGVGVGLGADVAVSNITVGPRYATATADLGGGAGSWATPDYAEGGP